MQVFEVDEVNDISREMSESVVPNAGPRAETLIFNEYPCSAYGIGVVPERAVYEA